MARLENPNVWDVSYQHPVSYDRCAVRLVVYLFRRSEAGRHVVPNPSWTTVPEERRFGDAKSFIRAANARTKEIREDAARRGKNLAKNKASWATSFVNVVLSPASRADLSDADFAKLIGPWVRDAGGRAVPFVGAVHREGAGKVHLHLGIVRDKFSPRELRGLKESTDALVMGLELAMERGLEWHQEQTLEQEQTLGIDEGGLYDELAL